MGNKWWHFAADPGLACCDDTYDDFWRDQVLSDNPPCGTPSQCAPGTAGCGVLQTEIANAYWYYELE